MVLDNTSLVAFNQKWSPLNVGERNLEVSVGSVPPSKVGQGSARRHLHALVFSPSTSFPNFEGAAGPTTLKGQPIQQVPVVRQSRKRSSRIFLVKCDGGGSPNLFRDLLQNGSGKVFQSRISRDQEVGYRHTQLQA
jgi:hypothetical protein